MQNNDLNSEINSELNAELNNTSDDALEFGPGRGQGKRAEWPTVPRDERYWTSLEQLNNDPEFIKGMENEFQSSPFKDEKESGWARRDFLKLMGASVALSTASCVRRPVEKIVPYNKQPEEVVFAVPNYYTSTWFDGAETFGLLVKTREGRPIKIEGNPAHPSNLGATSARCESHILSLYDPERLKGPIRNLQNEMRTNRDTVGAKWEDTDKLISTQLKKGGVVLLSGNIASPSTRQLIGDFFQAFSGRHVTWEAISGDEVRDGSERSFGAAAMPEYRFDRAQVVVSIDADFLGAWGTPVKNTKQWSKTRKPGKEMSRLYAFDSNFSLTGANADLRYKIKPSQQVSVVMGLLHEIVVKQKASRFAGNAALGSTLSAYANVASEIGLTAEQFAKVASDLWANRGKSLVVAGGLPTLTAQASDLQVAVNMLNAALDNEGSTIESSRSSHNKASQAEMATLISDMAAGKVKTLIVHRVNPVYGLPVDSGFAEAVKKCGMVIYTGDRNDEMGMMADYVLPDSHSLESWGDAEVSGVYSIQQPTIQPMYDTRSVQFQLMTWAYTAQTGPKRLTEPESYYDYLRAFWRENVFPGNGGGAGKSFDEFWLAALQTGVVGKTAEGSSRSFRADAASSIKKTEKKSGYELLLYPKVAMGDGRDANIGWLQEMPDPISKIAWDNYLNVSLATAEKEKLKQGDVVTVTVGNKKLDVPVNIQPGLHDEVLSLAIGYGRTAVGKVGNNVGVNALQLASFAGGKLIASGMSATIKKTGKRYELACTQGHSSMEGRPIVGEMSNDDFQAAPGTGIHKHPIFSIFPGHRYDGHKWGMSVDLNSCTGCSACTVACYSENGIHVVGKKMLLQGREMSWIRIDRYYVGNDPSNPEVSMQPVMCQHCDNAPCESVCPVLATVHSDEGLNEMIYNRCVGTRYCSNNCPYKVRRFNWFNYAKLIEKPMNMALNPEVTVRPRGVMEKCTFCVQRIKSGKDHAKLEKRKLRADEIKTACQSACPSDAITFGDLNNPESAVAKIFKTEPRAYALLEEWNAAPSVRYLSKIRNNGKVGASHHGEKHDDKHGEKGEHT